MIILEFVKKYNYLKNLKIDFYNKTKYSTFIIQTNENMNIKLFFLNKFSISNYNCL